MHAHNKERIGHKAMYYIAETGANNSVNNSDLWKKTNAKTLRGAKIAASKMQVFQGTALHIAVKRGDKFECVTVRRADAVNMNLIGVWKGV